MHFFSSILDCVQQGIASLAARFIDLTQQKNQHPMMHGERHPLLKLFEAQQNEYATCKNHLKTSMRDLYQEMRQLKLSKKKIPNSTSLERIQHAIHELVLEKFAPFTNQPSSPIFETLLTLKKSPPQLNFPQEDTAALIEAFDRHGHLGRAAKYGQIWENYEKNKPNQSTTYTLNRRKLPQGEIGYINGIATSPQIARSDAERLSQNLASNFDVSGIYNASQGFVADMALTIGLQGGVATTPTRLLVDQWMNFFHHHPDDKYLQICFSQGVVHVKNALELLDPELRKKICVIAIAPAAFISPQEGCEVMHFYKPTDHFFHCALGRSKTENRPDVIQVDPNDGEHPHDPHGKHFIQAIQPYVQNYIQHHKLY